MGKIVLSKISDGERIVITEKEMSEEDIKKIRDRFVEVNEQKIAKMKKRLKDVPEIHWEILGYSNTHTKEEVLLKYPDYVNFINSITFN